MQPELFARLVAVLEEELGHDLAFAVEAGKIAANNPNALSLPEIKLDTLERGLHLPLPAAMMAVTLADMARQIAETAKETVDQAGLQTDDVTRLVFVGGSSLMGVVDAALRRAFPKAEVHQAAALTGVVDGLALAAATAFD